VFLDVLTFFMVFRGTSKSLDSQRSKHIVTPSAAHLIIYKIKKHYKRINDVRIYSFSQSISVSTLILIIFVTIDDFEYKKIHIMRVDFMVNLVI
jgi:hypothetical protein